MSLSGRKSNGERSFHLNDGELGAHALLLSPSMSGLRKQWCPQIVDLIERMWAQEHQDRPTMSEVVNELERLVEDY